VKEFIKNI